MESPPFEVTETGWGEFQLNIRIVFQDANQKPLSLVHHLKLYPTEEAGSQLKTSRPVVSEHYEEIIFDPPTAAMAEILSGDPALARPETSPRYAECTLLSNASLRYLLIDPITMIMLLLLVQKLETEELDRIAKAIEQVQGQIAEVRERAGEPSSQATVTPSRSANASTAEGSATAPPLPSAPAATPTVAKRPRRR